MITLPVPTQPQQNSIYRTKAARRQILQMNLTAFPVKNYQLWFTPRTVIAYNYTNQWIELTDYNIFVPPNTMGLVIPLPELNGLDNGNVDLLAPAGRAEPSLPTANEICTLWWLEQVMQPTVIG